MTTLDHHYAILPLSLPTEFPAIFGGNQIIYTMALFSLMAVSLGAMAAIIETGRGYRRYRGSWRGPAQMYRMSLICLLFCSFMFTFPGAVFNLMWHETPTATLRLLEDVRIYAQALCWIPFLIGMVLFALSRRAVRDQLERQPLPVDLWDNRTEMLKSGAIAVICLAIAVLVAYAK